MLGSRKINLWFFKTQEEIKTSHEHSVAFALNNENFESIISGDDDGTIAVWDIEEGKLVSKFNNTHSGTKISAGCLDGTSRRIVTAGKDGTVKIWNFSNGEMINQLYTSGKGGPKVDTEVTCILRKDDAEIPYIMTVGWDRKINVWADFKNSEKEIIS